MIQHKMNGKKILLVFLISSLFMGGCQIAERDFHMSSAKTIFDSRFFSVGGSLDFWNEIIIWPIREEFDKNFNSSRYSTLEILHKKCSCGAVKIGLQQSYTDAALEASAVRECPLGSFVSKDNQVTERYATSFYCPDCKNKELTFESKEIWIYRPQMGEPHYHLDISENAWYWSHSFVDYYGQKWLCLYDVQDNEKNLLEKVKIASEATSIQTMLELEGFQIKTRKFDFDVKN